MAKRKLSTRKKASKARRNRSAEKHAVGIIGAIYRLAKSDKLLDAKAIDPTRDMLRDALIKRDTRLIFEWLAQVFSLQGISDRVAIEYARQHGSAAWKPMADDLARGCSCPKLRSFWHYERCDYSKSLQSCSRPDHIANCPVPKMRLRNGRLNITAWSLFLFIRDATDGDLVGWVAKRIRVERARPRTIPADRQRLLGPLNGIHGVADKVLSMALADLLLAAPPRWRRWNKIGASLLVVDRLVHNNLSRTGILKRFRAEHFFGPACYQDNGCADVIDRLALKLKITPRAFTHAIWRYCALDGFNICNGNRIDDRKPCKNVHCRLYGICDRRQLHVT